MTDDFEKEYDEFISRTGHDLAENASLIIIRTAFIAGWLAAGGEMKTLDNAGKINKPADL